MLGESHAFCGILSPWPPGSGAVSGMFSRHRFSGEVTLGADFYIKNSMLPSVLSLHSVCG